MTNKEININRLSIDGYVANNLMFILCDMIETCFNVAESEGEKANLKFDKKTQMLYNQIKYAAKDMRKRTAETGNESQEIFGSESDALLKLILTVISRTGDDMKIIGLVQNYAEAFSNVYKLNLNKFGV